MLPADLPVAWKAQATLFREHAEEPVARTYELCAEQLDLSLTQAEEEPLTLRQASDESGYSADHLGRLVRDGKITIRDAQARHASPENTCH